MAPDAVPPEEVLASNVSDGWPEGGSGPLWIDDGDIRWLLKTVTGVSPTLRNERDIDDAHLHIPRDAIARPCDGGA